MMRLSSTLRRCSAVLAAGALLLVAPAPASAAAGGNVYFNWQIPSAPAAGLTNITFPVTVNPASNHLDGIYFAQQFTFNGLGGYIGLQPRADSSGSERLHATFSVFASSGAPGSYGNTPSTDPNCKPGADTAAGASCAVEFNAVYGHPYNLTVQLTGANTWTGTATDTVTNVSTHIGTWSVPATAGFLAPSYAGFIEDYLSVTSCATTPLADGVFAGPTTTDGGGLAGSVTMQNPPEGGSACTGQANLQSQAVGSGQHIVRGTTGSPSPLTGAGSGLCLGAPNPNAWGTQTNIEVCNAAGTQQWAFLPDSSASTGSVPTTALNAQSGVIQGSLQLLGTDSSGNRLCLDDNAGTAPGTAVTTWNCDTTNANANEQWSLYPDGSIHSVASGLCLDVSGGAVAAGSLVDLWNCTGNSSQRWVR
ncbi:RICIN domain-containing protein [Kitasatospora kifunensis]|uniref:Ricin B lectin domain-containing protein n=1 Tax=Kitasatospora kifunensis TaxID=58351 RepID=A0A7W7RAB4_KITKI|nr:RICIN domain-containing protein [Kitasatospora kifunensis]MBB4928234.1 hypothetical protein [Kitasatospora kifunensis]